LSAKLTHFQNLALKTVIHPWSAIAMSEMLQAIDRELIELLSKRIAILNSSNLPVQTESADINQLLAQTGVPEFVWQSITTSCAAAIAKPTASNGVKPRDIVVIGGNGSLGSFFVQELSLAGHNVSVFGRKDWDNPEPLLEQAELVLICVPIERTIDVIAKTAPYLNANTVLADITSIKTPIVQALLEHHTGPILSLHPMFGPGVQSFLSQNVVVCPVREQQSYQWLLDLIANRGGKLITCTPEEHDRMMIAIQAIRHFSTFSLGVFLAEEGIDISRSLDFASPLYRLEIDIVSRLFAQDSSLYVDIMLTAEERRQAIGRLAETYTRLAQLVAQKDRAALKREFETTRNAFKQEASRALQESNHVISSLSLLLAANDAEESRSAEVAELLQTP